MSSRARPAGTASTTGGDGRRPAPATDRRSDLLDYLRRYRDAGSRRIVRADRWRHRGRSAAAVAGAAERVAVALDGLGVGADDRVAVHVQDGPLWHAAFFGVQRLGAVAVPLEVTLERRLLRKLAAELELAAWCTDAEGEDGGLELPRVELAWRDADPDAGGGEVVVVERRRAGTRAPGRGDDEPSSPGAPGGRPSPAAPAWPPEAVDRVAEVVLTSGTSGVPTPVSVRHANLRSVLDGLEAEIDRYGRLVRLAPRLRLAVSLPLSHLYGQVMGVFLPELLDARTLLLPTLPAPAMARALRRDGSWILATVPRTLEMLGRYLRTRGEELWGADGFERRLRDASDRPWWIRCWRFRRLRRLLGWRLFGVVSGGAALDRDLEELWRGLGYLVVQGYGLTETAPLVTLNHPFDTEAGSLGRALPGVEVRIAEDGEILVRGPNVVGDASGDGDVDRRGWLHTGDLGRLDDSGRLYFRGRKGERIVTPAGVNVDPAPVRAALRRLDRVVDAVVLERPWGRPGVVAAILVLRPGADPGEVVERANRELDDAARIRAWFVWPEADFPRTHTGKPRRGEILGWLRRRRAATEADGDRRPGATGVGPPTRGAAAESDAGEADAYTRVARMVARIADVDASGLHPETRVDDVLTSLDRVELATELETTYGVDPGPATFVGDRTLRELAAGLFDEGDEVAGPRVDGSRGARSRTDRRRRAAAADEGHRERSSPAPDTAEAPDRRARPERPRQEGTASDVASPPAAAWRSSGPARLGRTLIQEIVMRSLWELLFELDADGQERLEGLEPPFIVAANHLSVLDPGPVLFSLPPDLRARVAPCAMWEHFAGARTGGWQYRLGVLGLNLVPLVQSGDWRPTLRIAGRVADRGGCPLIYPEGRRSPDGELLEFRLGVAVMARELHLPVVPCAAAGLLSVLPEGARWAKSCWLRRARVAIRYGRPLPPPRSGAELAPVVESLRERIEKLCRRALEAAGRA